MNDSIDDFFEREREAVPLLAPPSGRYEQLQHVARRRRNRNTTAVSMAAAVVVAVVGTGTVLGTQGLGSHASRATFQAGTTTAASHNPSAGPTTAPVATTPVPQGFEAWSVTFVRSGAGYTVGGYPCTNGQSCFAIVETTDSMASWHTIAELGPSATYGIDAASAILRFAGNGNDGWLVGSQEVWSTHDTGRTWHEVKALHGQSIDALEATGSYTYAIGRGSGDLWVTSDQSSDRWTAHSDGLPLGDASAHDSLQVDDKMVAAIRTTASTTEVQFSGNFGLAWQTLPSPCEGHGATAPAFALVDEHITRFFCGDGTVFGYLDGSRKLDAKFDLRSDTGTPVSVSSVSTNHTGTVVAYSGAGIWDYVGHPQAIHALTGADVGYVGLSGDRPGIALPAVPGPRYWVTDNGGLTWEQRSWN